MSLRRTAPSRLPEGGGLGSDRLSPESEVTNSILSHLWSRLACICGTLTMCLVGTVYGWTWSSRTSLTNASGDVPVTLTHDEFSWSVSLTVLGSMFGSLLAAHLADRIGRKYCLLACSMTFAIGWYNMYSATSAPMLYFAQGILGIGVGIARTINPMFVSEVTDIKFRGSLAVLTAANVYSGTLLTHLLRLSLTYTSHLGALAGISMVPTLLLMLLRDTPYFYVAKGQKTQACKSIAHYKDIRDPEEVKIELRALRAEARYGLHLQSRSDLSPPYTINLPSTSSSDLPPPYSSIFPLPSRSDLPPPYSSISPSPSRRDLHPPDRSNLPSQSIREAYAEVFSQVHQQPRGVLRLQPTRESFELRPLPSRELHSQSTSEEHRPSTSQIHRPSSSQILPQMRSELHSRRRSVLHTQSSVDSGASTDIPETFIAVTKYTCLDKLRAILQRSNRKALFIMLGLIMAQQLTGNFTATQYLEKLIERETAFLNTHTAMMAVELVRIFSGYSTVLIVEWYGRRTLLILSTLGSTFTLLLLACYRILAQYNYDVSTISFLSIIDLILYHVLFQIGLGTLPNVLQCDLFPTKLKGFAGAIVVIFDGIIGLTASKLNQVITDNAEWYAIFFTFATLCLMAFAMVFIWVPETKGKTHHEIEAFLVGENLNSSNEEFSSDEMDIRRI